MLKAPNLLLSTQDIAQLLPEVIRTDLKSTYVLVDGLVPDGENRGERTFRAVSRQCLLYKSSSE